MMKAKSGKLVRSGGLAGSAVLVASAIALAAMTACGYDAEPPVDRDELAALDVPAELQEGESLFDAHCAECHGELALGTDQGPPLVHPVYEPSHHGDAAFILAVERGVSPHHWRFGPMPPVPEVSREEVEEVTDYVRWLQRAAGID